MSILSTQTLSSAILFGIALLSSGAQFPVGPAIVRPDGSFSVDGQSFRLQAHSPNWQPADQSERTIVPDPGFPKMENGAFVLHGRWTVCGGNVRLKQQVVAENQGRTVKVIYHVENGKTPVRLLSVYAPLRDSLFAGRPVQVNGKEFVLSEKFSGQKQTGREKAGTVFSFHRADAASNLEVSTSGMGEIIDLRNNIPFFFLRGLFPAFPKAGGAAELTLKITDRSAFSKPLSLSGIVNRGFADDVQGDGKGGWTDQGPTNDLRMFRPGSQRLGGINYDVINPAKNNGKSCLVLPFGVEKQVSLPVAAGTKANYLYLLHTAAWITRPGMRIGTLSVVYTDGTKSTFPIESGKTTNDWWNPQHTENGRIVWTFDKGRVKIGLSASCFKLDDKEIAQILFHSPATAAWMVVAASLGDAPLPPGRDFPPTVIAAGSDWMPATFDKEVIPGSAMDFSFLLDAPAGKYGFVKVKNGTLAFEKAPEKNARFYGTNFCFATCFPDRETAELVAERLAAYGLNAVRITHHDGAMSEGSQSSLELNGSRMDRMDYFVSCLKKHGIYVITDFFVSRPVRPGEIPGVKGRIDPWNGAYKALVLIDPEARKNYLAFVRNWMEHVNPYTGLAWKEEPSLIGATVINEGNLDHWIKYSNSSEVTRRYAAAFEQYLQKNRPRNNSAAERERLHLRFLAEVHDKAYREIVAELRAMGVKFPLTDQNMRNWPRTTFMRGNYDFSDNHAYVDHPTGAMPSRIENKSVLSGFGAPVAAFAAGRNWNKPFFITEFNWCYPNAFRRESGVIMGSLAAFQNWSGLFRFAYAHPESSLRKDRATVAFETNTDPINLFSDRIGALLFLRGDLKPAKNTVLFPISEKALESEQAYPAELSAVAWYAATGSVIENNRPIPPPLLRWNQFRRNETILPPAGKGVWNPRRGFLRSSSGEMELDATGETLKIVTAHSEILLRNSQGKLSGERLSAVLSPAGATVGCIALDHAPLGSSKRMLVLHLTDMLNTNDTFADPAMRLYEKVGTLPHLLRRGKAQLTLRLEGDAPCDVYALNFSGARCKKIPAEFVGGVLRFVADTACSPEGIMAYEIVRK
ncbi:MAG: hypothetical protein PHS41_06595 [Victivallaceae bacterium]|nr:hypothetical protein [Victivallaceae bacterium]